MLQMYILNPHQPNLFCVASCIPANGTAVVVVCVTGASSRVLVPVLSSEVVPVASWYGAIFAITVREGFITIAVQVVC